MTPEAAVDLVREALAAERADAAARIAGLESQLAKAKADVQAYQTTHRQLAARLDRTTAILGGKAPTPQPFNVGATLAASFLALEAAAADALARPTPPAGPDIRGTRFLRLLLPPDAPGETLDATKAGALEWLGEHGFSAYLREQDQPLAPLELAIDTGWAAGRGFVDFHLAPPSDASPYVDPWADLIQTLTTAHTRPDGTFVPSSPIQGHFAK